jgi:hypothetical protein
LSTYDPTKTDHFSPLSEIFTLCELYLTKLKQFSRSVKSELDEAVNNSIVTSAHDEFLAKPSSEKPAEETANNEGEDKDSS